MGAHHSKNYYKILGIKYPSNPDEIKQSYYKLAKLYHPDTNGDDDNSYETQEIFRLINEAYDVLSNPDMKAAYDDSRDPNRKKGSRTF